MLVAFAQIKEGAEVGIGIAREFGVVVAVLVAMIAFIFIAAYFMFRYIFIPVRDGHLAYLRDTAKAHLEIAAAVTALQAALGHGHTQVLDKIGSVDTKVDGLTGKVDSISRRIRGASESEERVLETQEQLRQYPKRRESR